MTQNELCVVVAILSYFIGSIPFGYLVAKAKGVDIQKKGSGNIGASNIARVLGKKIGLGILLLDATKGVVAMLLPGLGYFYLVAWSLYKTSPFDFEYVQAISAICVVIGHCFPLWLRFRGGKGVATSLGVFAVWTPIPTAIAVCVFIIGYLLSRITAVGSLLAVIAFITSLLFQNASSQLWLAAIVIVGLIVVRHIPNLKRLAAGKENRV